jgi:DNA-directed RNA polymerase III subunit RPC6
MASSSAAVNVPAGGADIKGLKDKVYEACLEIVHEQDGMVIKQNDIQDLGFDGLEDINTLLQVVQVLINEKYFKVVHDDGSIAWKVRSLDEAKRCVHFL